MVLVAVLLATFQTELEVAISALFLAVLVLQFHHQLASLVLKEESWQANLRTSALVPLGLTQVDQVSVFPVSRLVSRALVLPPTSVSPAKYQPF